MPRHQRNAHDTAQRSTGHLCRTKRSWISRPTDRRWCTSSLKYPSCVRLSVKHGRGPPTEPATMGCRGDFFVVPSYRPSFRRCEQTPAAVSCPAPVSFPIAPCIIYTDTMKLSVLLAGGTSSSRNLWSELRIVLKPPSPRPPSLLKACFFFLSVFSFLIQSPSVLHHLGLCPVRTTLDPSRNDDDTAASLGPQRRSRCIRQQSQSQEPVGKGRRHTVVE